MEINIIMLFILLEMQSTRRQQKKYFFSVSNGDDERKIFTGHKFPNEGCIYVDKTPLIKRLVKMTNPYSGVFVNRPRRFGKSLLVHLGGIFQTKQGSV